MTRDEWLQQFEDELVKLRPHLAGSKTAHTLALNKYDAKEHPRDLARQYHKQQAAPAPPAKQQTRR